jgi:hypothetical protein
MSLSWRRDALPCAALAAATVGWLAIWPRDLNWYDEGLFLYEAKRIAAGAVLYRDLFEIVTPGAWYAMAAMFGIFGASLGTARAVMTALHLVAVVALYLTCRMRDVRRTLAVAAGLAYLAVSYPGMPYATPHWFSTLLNILLLLVFLLPVEGHERRRLFVAGLICGAMSMVQQQRAAMMIAGVIVLVLLARLVDRRLGASHVGIGSQLATFIAGIGLIALPIMSVAIVQAGPDVVVDGLIRFPLENYRRAHQFVPWAGYAGGVEVESTLLTWLPILIAVPVLRMVVYGLRHGAAEAKALLAEAVLSAAAILSIAYHPNVKHLAVTAPLLYVIFADALEQVFRRLAATGRIGAWAAAAVTACLFTVLLGTLYQSQVRRHALYPVRQATAFGVVEYTDTDEQAVVEAVGRLLANQPSGDLLCYPHCPGLYLTTGTRNPTRYQLLSPDYIGPERIDDALRVLEAQRVPLVVIEPLWTAWRTDPVVAYVREHYDRIKLERSASPKYAVFKRRASPDAAPARDGPPTP